MISSHEKSINLILDSFISYIVNKSQKIESQKKTNAKKTFRINPLILSSSSSSSNNNDYINYEFKVLKTFIDKKISIKVKKDVIKNDTIMNILIENEYDKYNIEHQLLIGPKLKEIFKNIIEQEKENEIRNRLKQKEEEELRKQNLINSVPRFQIGMPIHDINWNSFFYDPKITFFIHDLARYQRIEEYFFCIFNEIINEKDESKMVLYTEPVDVIKDEFDYNNKSIVRKLSFILGFIFEEPYFEKYLMEYISHFFHVKWWYNYRFKQNDDNENFSITNYREAKHIAQQHLKQRLIPIFTKIYVKYKPERDDNFSIFTSFLEFVLYSITEFEPDDYNRINDPFKKFLLAINQTFNEWYSKKYQKYRMYEESFQIIKKEYENDQKITSSSIDIQTPDHLKDLFYDKEYLNDFFNGEKLLQWFVSNNYSNDIILSRYTSVSIQTNEDIECFKFLINHIEKNHDSYQKFSLFLDYLRHDSLIKRIIPSSISNYNKPPMMNISPYLMVYFYSVFINPYSYDNVCDDLESVMYENLFIVSWNMLHLMNLSSDIIFDLVIEDEEELSNKSSYVVNNVMLPTAKNNTFEGLIMNIIFNYVCKRSYFTTCYFLIEYFLNRNTNLVLLNDFLEIYQSDPNIQEKKRKEKDNIIVKYINNQRKTLQDGMAVYNTLIRYMFFKTSPHSAIRFFVACRILQNSVGKYYLQKNLIETNQRIKDKNLKEKIDDDLIKSISLSLKNKRFQESITNEKETLTDSLYNISIHDIQIRDMIQDFKKTKHQNLLAPLNNHFLSIMFKIFNDNRHINQKSQESILKWFGSYFTKIISVFYDENIDINIIDIIVCLIERKLKENNNYVAFAEQILVYYKTLRDKNIQQINDRIMLVIINHIKEKTFHELFYLMIMLKIYIDLINNNSNEIIIHLQKYIDKKKILLHNEKIDEKNKNLYFNSIGSVIVKNKSLESLFVSFQNDQNYNPTSDLFEKYSPDHIDMIFDQLNMFLQLSILFTHHYDWINPERSINYLFLKKIHQNQKMTIDSHSYYDLNSKESSTHIRLKQFQIDFTKVENNMWLIFLLEKLFIEKTNRNARVFSNAEHLYHAAYDCAEILQKEKIDHSDDHLHMISHTPVSKYIAKLLHFVKIKVSNLFRQSLLQSNYPEDAFVLLLWNEKQKTVEIIQSILNFIISVFSRIKMAATMSDHSYFKQKNLKLEKIKKNNFKKTMNPIKYQIQDALLNHSFHIRMLQKYVKNNNELMKYSWFVLPSKYAREFIGPDSSKTKVLELLETNRVDPRYFKKKHNPKSYLAWRSWFCSIDFIDLSILLNEKKPYQGRIYCINQELPKMPFKDDLTNITCDVIPIFQPSDSLVLNLSNIPESSCSSSSNK